MSTLLNNKGLSKSEMAVAVEMEIIHELTEVREQIVKTQGSENPTPYTPIKLATLRGKENGLKHILEFMSKNMKK